MLRYIYILHVDNRGRKSRYWGQKTQLYTGQTNNLGRRMWEHIRNVSSGHLTTYFRYSSKKLVYVEYIHGTEEDAEKREYRIKRNGTEYKKRLIKSEKNRLVAYIPMKAIILKHPEEKGAEVAIRM